MVPTWKPALEMNSYKPFCCGPVLEPLFASHLNGEQLNASTGFFERSFFERGGGEGLACLYRELRMVRPQRDRCFTGSPCFGFQRKRGQKTNACFYRELRTVRPQQDKLFSLDPKTLFGGKKQKTENKPKFPQPMVRPKQETRQGENFGKANACS